jgi:uncharacterized pyridoxamine 5'-phosphate oxidase family protein
MDFKECVKFANDHKLCYLATAEGDQPRLRAMGMWYADETGFYFSSQTPKALVNQLAKNPKVEIAFFDPGIKPMGGVLRVSGNMEFVDDIETKSRVYADRPFLKGMGVEGPDSPLLSVFRLAHGEAHLWTGANSMYEDDREIIKF